MSDDDDTKGTGTAYALWLANLFGVAGLHRFYLGRPVSGVLYLLTWGFLGLGSFLDLFLIPNMVRDWNRKQLPPKTVHLHLHGNSLEQTPHQLPALPPGEKPESSERQILRLAAAHGGVVTPQLVALETDLSLADAKRELRALVEAGYCTVDVGEDGAELYCVSGLSVTKPIV